MPDQWKMALNIIELKIILTILYNVKFLSNLLSTWTLVHLSSKLFSLKQCTCAQSAHVHTLSLVVKYLIITSFILLLTQ